MAPLSRSTNDDAERLTLAPRAYVAAVAAAAGAMISLSLPHLDASTADLVLFALLAAGAALGSLSIVTTEPNHGFNTGLLFVGAAALLLQPGLVALVGIAHVAPEIVRRGFPWYSQVFNCANYSLNALASWYAFHTIGTPGAPWVGNERTALATAAACLVLVGTNHLLLAIALRLARGRLFRESGLFSWKSLSTDLLLAALGSMLACAWRQNPYFAPLVLAPFVLINRSFSLLEQLRRSEARFRAIYESTAAGIRLSDAAGRLITANGAFTEMVGASSEPLAGTAIAEFVHPEDLERQARISADLLDGHQDRATLEHRYVRRDGSVGWAHVTESVVHDADGKPAFVVGMVHDVTQRKQLEERLTEAQKLEAVGRLAGGVAHDFNNLLTVIGAHSRFVLGSLDAGEPIGREDVDAIAKAAEKAGALTSQLLAFGRRQPRQPRLVDLNAVILELHPLLDRSIGNGVRIGLGLEASLAPVQADVTQVEQVIVNLAINGGDAMPESGQLVIRTATVPPPASVAEPAAERYVAISVSDTGCGMDAETKARMFEPFFTTKQAKGTGLGLASVYGIVAQSGGVIEVESEPGAGTTIHVFFPAATEGECAADVSQASLARTASAKLLVVDDEDLVRAAARRILVANGYEVVEAFDAREALAVLTAEEIDLLVTDLSMPDMGGRELTERVLETRPGLSVVFVSGYTDDAVSDLPKTCGEVRFVQKPFSDEKLLAAVSEALGGGSVETRGVVGASTGR